jgi:hypothetical protein
MKQEVSKTIGRTLGTVEHAPESVEDRGGGPCMRVRVRIDITKPLCRVRKITTADNTERCVAFQYERLSNFCYWCRKVSHGEKDCTVWLASADTLQQSDQQFGPWMRAISEWGTRYTTIRVEGYNRQTHEEMEPERREGVAKTREEPNLPQEPPSVPMEV